MTQADVEATKLKAYEGQSGSFLKTTRAVASAAQGKPEIEKQFTLADVDPIGRTEAMLYGPPKTGKTTAWATLPPPFRVIDADNGLKSIRWAFKAGKTSMTSPDQLVAYRPHEELDQAYPKHAVAFDKVCDMVDHWFSPGEVEKWEGGTMVIDSFTEMNEWAINKGLELNSQTPTAKKPLSTSHTINLKVAARLITGQQDYKSAMAFLDTFLNNVRIKCATYDRNLIVVCHEYTEDGEDADGNRIILRYRPLLIGQLRERLPKSFDDLWHMVLYHGIKGPEPKIQVHGDPRTIAGTRFGAFLEKEQDPDYREIMKKVRAFHGITGD